MKREYKMKSKKKKDKNKKTNADETTAWYIVGQ